MKEKIRDKIYYKDGTYFEGWHLTAPHIRDSSKILHREDGPAVELSDGDEEWWLNDKLHRIDGPAIEGADGSREWYQNDKLHRIDGPAIEEASGSREWYQNGKFHREDGPAIESIDGVREWWLDGIEYDEQEYLTFLKEIDSLEPMIGLTDTREWVRNRWKKLNKCHRTNSI